MRVAPVGLLFAHDPIALVQVAHDQGRMTHQDRRCSAGAIAIAGTTAYAARAAEFDARAVCSTVSEWVWPFDSVLANSLLQLPSWLEEPPQRAVQIIARIGMEPDHDDGWDGISPFVTPSVLWSLYAALRSPRHYWEAISTAIAVGGDVDTTAAMTGAIVGASVGLEGLPREAAQLVHDCDQWAYDDLVELAGGLHRLHRRLRGQTLGTTTDQACS